MTESELQKESETKEWGDLHFSLWAFFYSRYLISIDQMNRIKKIINETSEVEMKEHPHFRSE